MRDREFEIIPSLICEGSRITLGPDQRRLLAARLGAHVRATSARTNPNFFFRDA